MRLKWLELENFKQYYGLHKVEFAGFDKNDETNVTVIYGENGKGKTTLYRAILFALHGDTVLEQDNIKSTKQGQLYLCNLAALQESEDQTLIPKVTLAFEHKGEYYEISREIVSSLFDNGKIDEMIYSVQLVHTDILGRTQIIKNDEYINTLVKEVLDPNMKHYFLFDGEQIDQMTKSDQFQKQQVAKGIKRLLNIDALNGSVEVLSKLKTYYRKNIQQTAEGDHALAWLELERVENKIEYTKTEISLKQNRLEELGYDKKEIDEFLETKKDIREKVAKRKDLENDLFQLNLERKNLKVRIREYNKITPLLIGKDLLQEFQNSIEFQRDSLGKSFNINAELLKEFISNNQCGICGSMAPEGSSQYEQIQLALANISEHNYREALAELRNNTMLVNHEIENKKEILRSFIEEYGNINKEIRSKIEKIDEISEEIGNQSNNESAEKEKARDKIISEIASIETKLKQLDVDLKKLNEEKNAVEKDEKNKRSQQGKSSIFEEMKSLAEQTEKALQTIQKDFTDEVSRVVSETASRIYHELLDDDSRMNLKEVVIKDDFSLDVRSWNNNDFLANISSGQRHILSIAFILALLEISEGTSGTLQTPLFMDTPFGRISGTNRDNLLSKIPRKAAQWILLVTDTEFTKAEARALRPTGKWGKLYEIELIGPGKATISENPVLTFEPKR
jgi:DNA sulfur modification protein DndD